MDWTSLLLDGEWWFYPVNLVLLTLFIVMIRQMVKGRRHWVFSVIFAALGAMWLFNLVLAALVFAYA